MFFNKNWFFSFLEKGPVDRNVFERGLVDDDEPLIKDILVESGAYYKNTKDRHFNGTILGYVTPWNNHGYDVAKIWASKFDLISPVWLQIIRLGDLSYEVRGIHDIDKGWVDDVRNSGEGKTKSKVEVF